MLTHTSAPLVPKNHTPSNTFPFTVALGTHPTLGVTHSITRQTEHLKTKVFFVEGDGSLDIAGVEDEPVQRQRHLGFLDFCRPSVPHGQLAP